MTSYGGSLQDAQKAMDLQKKRQREKEDAELRKKKIESDLKVSQIDNKFTAHYDAIEAQLKANTVGLVTLDEMKAKQEASIRERERQLAQKQEEKQQREQEDKQRVKEQRKKQIQTLSFRFDEDEEEEENDDETDDVNNKDESDVKPQIKREFEESNHSTASNDSNSGDQVGEQVKKRKMMKNPDVDTSFLPDKEREEEEKRLREQLRQEWEERQARMKEEEVEITYSYWDGSGHRKCVSMKKGHTIYQFLQRALEQLRAEFHELRVMTADNLMYVKEDLIIPHHYTFYDFIVTKARGKSGPLFSFDVHDDVRLLSDVSLEKDESHAGKVLLRSWYERNKHIFPASRWEPYDPSKTYEKYTIKDSKK